MKRTRTITKATKSPAPESAANTGLTCELCCLVRKGTVDGVTGRLLPPIDGSVLAVVVVAGTVVLGVVLAGGWVTTGCVVGGAVAGAVAGGLVVVGTVAGARVVVAQFEATQIGPGSAGTAPARVPGPASANPSMSAAAPAKRSVKAARARRSIANSVA